VVICDLSQPAPIPQVPTPPVIRPPPPIPQHVYVPTQSNRWRFATPMFIGMLVSANLIYFIVMELK